MSFAQAEENMTSLILQLVLINSRPRELRIPYLQMSGDNFNGTVRMKKSFFSKAIVDALRLNRSKLMDIMMDCRRSIDVKKFEV